MLPEQSKFKRLKPVSYQSGDSVGSDPPRGANCALCSQCKTQRDTRKRKGRLRDSPRSAQNCRKPIICRLQANSDTPSDVTAPKRSLELFIVPLDVPLARDVMSPHRTQCGSGRQMLKHNGNGKNRKPASKVSRMSLKRTRGFKVNKLKEVRWAFWKQG